MNPTIEIKHTPGGHCSPDCSIYRRTCKLNDNYFTPGPDCPGPGRYRLIDEVAIEELWDEWVDCLEGQDKEQVTMILTAAGLGRKDEHED
jgi:hypothetical protein